MQQHLTAASKLTEDTVRGGGKGSSHYLLRVTAISLAVAIFLSAGVAIASAEAGPDSYLYPVKRALEDLKTSLASDPVTEAWLNAGHASARLDEMDDIMRAGRPEYAASLLASYDEHMRNAYRCIDEASARNENTVDLEAKLRAIDDQRDILIIKHSAQLKEHVPETVETAFRNSEFRRDGKDDEPGLDDKGDGFQGGASRSADAGVAANNGQAGNNNSGAAGSQPGSRDNATNDAGQANPQQGNGNGSSNQGHSGQSNGNQGQGQGQGNGSGNSGGSSDHANGSPGRARGQAGLGPEL